MKTVIGVVGLLSVAGFVVAACSGGGSGGGGGGSGATAGIDGGGMGGGGTSAGGNAGTGAGGSGGGTVECASDDDCVAKMPATNPPDCAEAKCDLVLKKCNFVAKDADGDGHTAKDCSGPGGGAIDTGDDCDDADSAAFPGSGTEKCNGRDDDCDGQTDEDAPNLTDSCTAGVGECQATGVKTCKDGGYSGCSATPGSPSPDSPLCDGKDHDCDGKANTGCGCTSGQKQTCHATDPDACNKVEIVCANGTWPACPAVVKKKEYCADGDKDGYCDLKFQCNNWQCAAPAGGLWKEKSVCQAQTDCHDSDPNINPGVAEKCDGIDNNCAGGADEGFGLGAACSAGTGACKQSGTIVCKTSTTSGCSVSGGNPDNAFHDYPAPNGSWDWNCNGCTEQYYAVEGFISNGLQNCNCSALNQGSCLADKGCGSPCGTRQSCTDHPQDSGGCWYADNVSQPSSWGGCGELVSHRSCWWSNGQNKCMGGGGFDAYKQSCR